MGLFKVSNFCFYRSNIILHCKWSSGRGLVSPPSNSSSGGDGDMQK